MSRDPFCMCPSCLGTQIKDERCHQHLMTPSAPLPVIKPLFRPQFTKEKSRPELAGDFQPGLGLSDFAHREAFHKLIQKTWHEHEVMQDDLLLKALGMSAKEAMANRHRITRHCHPGKDVFLLDGEPVVAIHKPVIRGDELVTTYQILRTLP